MSDEAKEIVDKKETKDSGAETDIPADVVAEDTDSKRKADEALEPEKKKKKKRSKHSKYDELDEPKTDSDDEEDAEDEGKDIDDDKLLVEDEEEDDLAEIDASNIITQGRRTRGKVIDYTKVEADLKKQKEASEKAGIDNDEEEDDEEEDDDFKEPEEKK